MKKKKIVFVIPSLGIGGAEVFCANLAQEFSKRPEFDVHLIVYFNIISTKFEHILSNNITLHVLNKKPGFSLGFIKTLKKTLKSIQPDVINSHSSHALRYLLLLNFLKKIPIFHTITNDPSVHDKLCYLLVRRRMHQKKWSKLHFIGISKLITNNLAKVYDYPIEKIHTIYNGLYKLEIEEPVTESFDFFNCANLTLVKRQTLLLEALSKMKKKASLCIAGSGPEEEKLKRLSAELGIENQVTFKGAVVDPTKLYFSSKCFILTSYSEGNPICINEAMSVGLPVIATNVGGIPDLIETNVNGFLFENDITSNDLALLMDKVLELDDRTINTIKNNNQKKVQQWYMDTIFEQYKKLFCDINK